MTLIEAKGLCLNFEASVAGGIPIIKALREGLIGNRVTKLFGMATSSATAEQNFSTMGFLHS